MFNMLNKTLLHIFDVEITFNSSTKSNFIHELTKWHSLILVAQCMAVHDKQW